MYFYNMKFLKSNAILNLYNLFKNHLIIYPAPADIGYLWGFGSLTGLFFAGQLISGIILAMHYTAHIDLAFNTIEHIMRDVNYGWLFRYWHSNGASFVFIGLYIHMARGLYFSSYLYPHMHTWGIGIILFILMMAIAFMGYVLPYGQMSYWGATVILNLFSAIPVIGNFITEWLLGGFTPANPTLNRFFSFHYLLPFVVLGLILIHLNYLHLSGSTNPIGFNKAVDRLDFYPYFVEKDIFILLLVLICFSYFLFYNPNILAHPDNYIEANSLVTPLHIVPEWYFLPFYAILRSIPNKLGGVICMALALIVLLFLPSLFFGWNVFNKYLLNKLNISYYFLNNSKFFNYSFMQINSNLQNIEKINLLKKYIKKLYDNENEYYTNKINYINYTNSPLGNNLFKFFFFFFFINFIILGFIGSQPVEQPYLLYGQYCTILYFFFCYFFYLFFIISVFFII